MNDRKKRIREILGDSPKSGEDSKQVSISAGHDIHNVTLIKQAAINISPGLEHITDAQAVFIKKLVHDVAREERRTSLNPVSISMVWMKLKDKLQVTSYKLIPKEEYSQAVGYLYDWLEQLMADRARSPEVLEGRATAYRRCHAIAKQYGLYAEMRTLMETKWQAESMRDLEDHQLDELLAFMKALEAQHRK